MLPLCCNRFIEIWLAAARGASLAASLLKHIRSSSLIHSLNTQASPILEHLPGPHGSKGASKAASKAHNHCSFPRLGMQIHAEGVTSMPRSVNANERPSRHSFGGKTTQFQSRHLESVRRLDGYLLSRFMLG